MKPFFPRLSLLAATLGALTISCHASPHDLDENGASIQRLPKDVQISCLSTLPAKDAESAALVCTAWHQHYQTLMTFRLRQERDLMLQDARLWSGTLSTPALKTILTQIFKEDGFAFIPFGYEHFPDASLPLSDADVAPLMTSFYTNAFREEKEALSSQDTLCLKAVLPWQRVFVSSNNPTAKVRALDRLGRVCPNPDLVRFSTTLASTTLTGTPKHLVLSTDELSKELEDFLTEGDDHHIHLVVEQKSSVKNDSLFLIDNFVKNIRHLTLSDPNGFAKYTAPSFLSQMENLISLDMKAFSALNRIIAGFGQQCSSLTFFDPRGLSGVTHIDSATFLEGTPFKSKETDQLKKLYEGKNTESSFLFLVDLYNRSLHS